MSQLSRGLIAIADASTRSDGTDIPLGEQLRKAATRIGQLEAENARLREVGEDALKALPVLRTMLESAGLAAGVIVAEGMLAHARAALAGKAGE